MAEAHLGPVFEIHGGGIDLVFPAPRERDRAVALARARLRPALDAQRDAAALRREDVEVAGQHRLAARGPSTNGDARRCSSTFSEATGASRSTTRTRCCSRRRHRRRASATSFAPSEPGGAWEAFATALDDDFNTPDALAVMHGWRDHDLLRRGLEVFGLESLGDVELAPAELEELARARLAARAKQDFATERPPARRDLRGRLGGPRRGRRAGVPARSEAVTAELGLRTAPRSGGAARAARGARAAGDTAGAQGGAVARRRRAARPSQARARAHGGGRHAGSPGRRRPRRALPLRRCARACCRPGAAARGAGFRHRPPKPGGGDSQRRGRRRRRRRAPGPQLRADHARGRARLGGRRSSTSASRS
jgi:hypothetical protein